MHENFWDGTKWVAEPVRQAPPCGAVQARSRRWSRMTVALVAAAALVVPFSAVAAASGAGASITVPNGVFAGTTTATVHTGPATWVHAACYQNGARVYEQYVKTDSNNQAVLTLGPTPLWPSGSASCTAAEGTWMANGKFKVTATTTFSVSG